MLAVCLLLGWRGARPLRELAAGMERLAQGQPVSMKENGATAELAEKLNQTSRRLQAQNRLIRRRDMTRADWIAGVSHDIRTPLALIMGYGEQLTRAMDNLLGNCVRHNPASCEIRITAEIGDGQLLIAVRDNGAGYPETVLRNLSGTGDGSNAPHILGLRLARQIAAAHGGQADFRNDGGTVALLHLPLDGK